MTLVDIKDKILKTEYAQKIYEKLRTVKDDDEYILGIMISFKTDNELKKLEELIDKGYSSPSELLDNSKILAGVVWPSCSAKGVIKTVYIK